MLRFLLLSLAIFIVFSSQAQSLKFNSQLDGYWTGAFIRNGNSTQGFTVDFYEEQDSVRARLTMTDWAFYPPFISLVQQEGRVVKFQSEYGELVLLRDSAFAEMVGECNFAKVHLKKGLRPPRRKFEKIDMVFDLGDISSEAVITKPLGPGPFPTLIIVHGRGCGSKNTWSRRPEVLSQYGLAVVRFDKRGHERTGFPCNKTSIDLHAKDLALISEQVEKLPFVSKLGLLGESAGGWTAPKAAAQTKAGIDFMITLIGPSTSIQQQQIDCSTYYVREQLKLDEQAVAEAVQYCKAQYGKGSKKKIYESLVSLLDSADAHGWRDVLEELDIPLSADKLDDLWCRRNQYDPAKDLQAFQGPFLSVLGGNDFVVPYRENVARFQQLFEEVNKQNYRITVIPSAGHGLEHGHKNRDLGYERSIKKWYSYFKFDRVAPGALDEVISFLREYHIIE